MGNGKQGSKTYTIPDHPAGKTPIETMVQTPTLPGTPGRASRALSLPNILTYGRILAVPAIVACYMPGTFAGRWLALAIFVAASVTDYLDGYLARLWHQQSAIGRMLDPIADKLLVATTLLLLASDNTVGEWSLIAAIIILVREVAVSGLREFLAEVRVGVPVSRLAKWKTTMQMVALAFLIAGPAGDRLFSGVHVTDGGLGVISYVGLLLLWISALVTLYTGYDYFRAGIRHIMTEDM
jgi:CDP-diacylglycerol--glycerol-3-phosphate 3-phosphatidyltransferase